MFAISEGREQGWIAPITIVAAVAGLLGAAAFIVVGRRREHPLLDVRIFAIRGLAAALGRDPAELYHRVMGDWRPTASFIQSLAQDASTIDATEREAIERASRYVVAH